VASLDVDIGVGFVKFVGVEICKEEELSVFCRGALLSSFWKRRR